MEKQIVKMESTRFSLNWTNFKSLGVSLMLAILGALATWMQDTIPGVDFGTYSPIVAGLNAVAINAIRKFIQNYGSIL